jgi:hypothetical protein
MTRPPALFLGLLLLACWPAAHAAAPPIAQAEINYLLGFIDRSGCKFYRNGSWYNSHEAQAHLRDKYDYLTARNLIHTAEDFIELAGTKSSMSGKAYAIQCQAGPTVTTNQWLHEALTGYRSSRGQSAPLAQSAPPAPNASPAQSAPAVPREQNHH